MRRGISGLVLVLSLVSAAPAPAQDIKGQKPVLIVDGAFQFTPRSWGSYIIHDKEKDEYYLFTMSVLDDETRKGKIGTWIEIDIDTFKERVVTRALAEKGPAGPGELMAAIVWVEGLKPFSVPEKYLTGADQEVGQFQVTQVPKRVESRSFTHDGQTLNGFLAEGVDPKGGVTRALVSMDIAPMGLVWADTPEMEIFLDDWGGGAATRIKEKPIGMFAWIMDMVSRGLSGEDVAIPERKFPPLRIDGTWSERDDACAGSRWTIGSAGQAAAANWRCGDATGGGALQGLVWKTPRIMTGRLAGENRRGQAQLMFVSDSRAVLVVKAPDGVLSTFSVLQKAR
jgi:hypothetical protein